MTERPSGFCILEAIFARYLLGAIPIEQLMYSPTLSRIAFFIILPIDMASFSLQYLPVSLQAPSSIENIWSTCRYKSISLNILW